MLTAAGAVLAAAGLTAGLIALDRTLDPFDDHPFSPVSWAGAESQGRGRMARDAIRHLSPGTTAARVRELLGEPQPVARDPSGRSDVYGNRLEHPGTWSYHLGNWSGLGPYGFDDAFLYVHFGPDGRVVDAEVTGG
jgi:hypothetical protein